MLDRKTRLALEKAIQHPQFRSVERDPLQGYWLVRWMRTRVEDAAVGDTLHEALSRALEFMGPMEEEP